MSVEIINSISINYLISNLIECIENEKIKYGPFHSPLVITPNVNLKKSISLKYAELKNICANIKFIYLEEGLTSSLKKLNKEEITDDYIFLNYKENHIYLELIILSILLNKEKEPELNFLYEYLGDETKKNYLLKAWQISSRLAGIFREYEYHREKIIDGWLNGKLSFDKINGNDFITRIEKAEKFIYEKIFIDNKIKNLIKQKINKEYITLPQYIKKISNISKASESNKDSIFIFGMSQISAYHYKIILKLSGYVNIKIFQLNYFQLSEETFSNDKLLNDFGKPQKENLMLFSGFLNKPGNKIFKNIFIDQSADKKKETLLQKTKDFILLQDNLNFKKLENQDDSFQVLGCPTKKKEIEAVYNNIIYNLKNNETLKITDIAVLVNDINDYTDIIKSVFNTPPQSNFNLNEILYAPPALNYNLSDSNAKTESIFGNYMIKAFELASSKFSRKNVFEFIENPFFLKSQNITRNEMDIFLNWADKLNIIYGYDESDKKKESACDSLLYTWKQGLKRVRFSRIMEPYKFKDYAKNFFDIIPFEDFYSKDDIILNKFISVFENLFYLLKKLNKPKKFSEWITEINNFIDVFFEIPDEFKEESKVIIKLKESLSKLEAFENIFSDKIEIAFVTEYLKKEISKISSSFGSYLTDGITISSMMPARPIPFKIIYIVGLNENNFPGNKNNLTLDLRNLEKIPGDVSKPEANNFLFLETFFSAEEKILITYQSKDLEKDQDFYISSTVKKFINYMNENILNKKFEIYDLLRIKNKNDNFFTELESSFNFCERFEIFLSGKYDLNAGQLSEINKKYELTQKLLDSKTKHSVLKEIKSISLFNFYDYLMNPVIAKLKLLFDIYDEADEDLKLIEDEIFYSENRMKKELSNSALKKLFSDTTADASTFINEYYKYNNITGNTPDGIFSLYDKNNILNDFALMNEKSQIIEKLESIKEYKFLKKISITENINDDGSILNFPLIAFFVDKKNENKIEIKAEMENFFYNEKEKKLETFIIAGTGKYPLSYKHFIKPVIFYFLLCCGNQPNKHNQSSSEFIKDLIFNINIIYKDGSVSYQIPKNISEPEIKNYILYLCEGLIENKNYDIIPFDIIIQKDILTFIEKQSKEKFYEYVKEKIVNADEYNDIFKFFPFIKIIDAKIPENIFDTASYRYKFFIDILKSKTEKTK